MVFVTHPVPVCNNRGPESEMAGPGSHCKVSEDDKREWQTPKQRNHRGHRLRMPMGRVQKGV